MGRASKGLGGTGGRIKKEGARSRLRSRSKLDGSLTNYRKKNIELLDKSEASKVSTKELKEQVPSPNEPNVNFDRIAMQAKKLFQIFIRQGANETAVARKGRWEEHWRKLIVLERGCHGRS